MSKACILNVPLKLKDLYEIPKRFQSTLWKTVIATNKEKNNLTYDDPDKQEITTDGESLSSNDKYLTIFENRNPRNLEHMNYGYKPRGWSLEDRLSTYWHRVFLKKGSRHIHVILKHYTGKEVVTASSNELCIRRHLYSSKDVCAVENVSRIFAQRCLQSGFSQMCAHFTEKEAESSSVQTFLRVLEEEGVSTCEPDQLLPIQPFSRVRIPKPPHYKA